MNIVTIYNVIFFMSIIALALGIYLCITIYKYCSTLEKNYETLGVKYHHSLHTNEELRRKIKYLEAKQSLSSLYGKQILYADTDSIVEERT